VKVLIYGAGAVGLGLASCLIKSKENVDLIARGKTAGILKRYGFTRTGIFGEIKAGPDSFGSYSSPEEISGRQYDYILVCVKSYDSLEVSEDLSRNPQVLNEDTKIILCQNGWGNARIFLNRFSKKQIYNARIITGFSRLEPDNVEITVHADAIHIGSLWGLELKGLEQLCLKISQGGIPCQVSRHISKDLWAKMLYNCALNPLGAILDVPYGELIKHEMSRKIMESIIKEIYEVMGAAGLETHWKAPRGFLKVFYEKLVPATAEHRSSTLQSLKAHKKTELDFLNGAVIKLASDLSVPVPVNSTIFEIVKYMEERQD
jgi:2-dehydropantoate 2-reductase